MLTPKMSYNYCDKTNKALPDIDGFHACLPRLIGDNSVPHLYCILLPSQ